MPFSQESLVKDPNGVVQGIEQMKRETGQQTRMTINEVRKRVFLRRFMLNNDHFTKTGSGQTH
jgi:hypothetical protein